MNEQELENTNLPIVWMYVEGAVSIRGLELESNFSFNKGSFKNSSGFMKK